MTGVVAAFSLSEQLKTLGALAGFAAVLGLAVLAMLYIAQAREMRHLREWVARAAHPAADVPQQPATGAQSDPRRGPAAPVSGAQSAPKQAAAAVARVAAAPVGAAATAVSAARKIATPGGTSGGDQDAVRAASQPVSAQGAPVGAPPAQGGPAPAPTANSAPAAGPEGKAPGAAAGPKGAPAVAPELAKGKAATASPNAAATAATPAAGAATPAASSGRTATAVAPPKTAAPPAPASAAGKAAAPVRAARPPSVTVPARTAAAGGTGPPGAQAAAAEQPGSSHMLAFVVGAVVVLLLILGGIALFGGDDEPLTPIEPTTTATGPAVAPTAPGATPAPLNRKSVTVAVLNGTTTNGLARGAANRLQRSGYRIGQVTNATDNSRAATSVSYAPGFRRAALDIARVVRVGARSVRPIDAATRVIAGEDALVVVTVGTDQSP